MYRSYEEVDRSLFTALSGMTVNRKGTLVPVQIFVGEPEEEVQNVGSYPAVSMYMIDEINDMSRGMQPFFYQKLQGNDREYGYYRAPLPLTFAYQFDLYSLNRSELVHLLRDVSKRLPPMRGAITDPDGFPVPILRTDYRELSRPNDEDRILRVAVTYELEAWMLFDEEPIDTVGVVEHIKIEVSDTQGVKEVTWVDDPPAGLEEEP